MSIVKRRKTSQYAQIHNNPLQSLEDLRAIGLMAHLMSLPADWSIHKMQLYKKFGRAAVSKGIEELEAKKYWLTIQYRKGKKNFYEYHISDVPFEDDEVKELIEEVMENYKILKVSDAFSEVLSIVDFEQLKKARQINDSSIVDFQQLNINSSSSTVENEQLTKKEETKEKDTKKKRKKEDHNPNPKQRVDTLDLPEGIKELIRQENLYGYGEGQDYANYDSLDPEDIEAFYHTCTYVKADADSSDTFYINDIEFKDIIRKILKEGIQVENTYGLLKSWTLNKLAYKEDNREYDDAADRRGKET